MPSAKILEQKKQIVSDLTDKLRRASAGVFVDYRGITVEEDTKLRAEMRKAGVDYAVVKNTLTRFAAKDAGLEGLDEILNGTTALAVSYDDPVAPAKILNEYAAKHENFKIKMGFVEGKVITPAEVKDLADIAVEGSAHRDRAGHHERARHRPCHRAQRHHQGPGRGAQRHRRKEEPSNKTNYPFKKNDVWRI